MINRALEVLQVKNEDIHIGSQRLLLFHSSRIVLNQGMKILGLQPLNQMWLFCSYAVSAISDLGYITYYSHCYSNSSIDIFMRAGHFTTKPALLFLCLPLAILLYLCPLCHISVLSVFPPYTISSLSHWSFFDIFTSFSCKYGIQ